VNESRTEVLVVGGGVLGLAHAIAALRAGYRVTLCERTRHARGASVRNFGMIWPIGQPAGPDLEIAKRSRQLWGEVADLAGFRCRPTGSLHLAHADDELAVLREFAARSPLPDLELLSPEAVRQRQPAIVADGLRGGLWSPHEANVDPPIAIAALHAWLEANGATVRRGCATNRVEAGVATFADGTRCSADHIVVCTGDDFATLFPALYADSDLHRCKLQMLALGDQPAAFELGPMLAGGLTLLHYRGFAGCPTIGRLRARLQAERGECLRRGIHVLVSQGDDGRLIVGDSHQYGAEFPPGLDERTERHILDYLATFLHPPDVSVTHRWSGCYALRKGGESTFRARPLAGVEVVTGVGGSGMTRSMALGEQTVRLWRMG
jgi:D-hydroxyproline dehydrogenase subunit beta